MDAQSRLEPSYRNIVRAAWPIVLANASVPLLGLVDTAVIGHGAGVADLGAIALGSLVFNFLYWGCGFLRMATTGFVAQASGAQDTAEVRAVTGRHLLLALGLGTLFIAPRTLLGEVALELLGASHEVHRVAAEYIVTRIWSAPASLATFVLMGTLIGLGHSRALLLVQLVLNGLNMLLDVTFVSVFGWGARGVAVGTLLAEWFAALLALWIVVRALSTERTDSEAFWPWARMKAGVALSRTLRANFDILLRTLCLLLGFGWFMRQGAQFGDVTLAANHVLLQFTTFSAFFLDGYANVAESLVGHALGARSRAAFDRAVLRSSVLAFGTAALLAAVIWLAGDALLGLLTDLDAVRRVAREHLPFAALYVALAVLAFQLDGVFIGATRTRDMLLSAAASVIIFLSLGGSLVGSYQNRGLWLAFLAYALARGLSLLVCVPKLRRSVGGG